MVILITGANGFLGHYLTGLLLQNGHQVLATGRGPCRLPFASSPAFRYQTMDFTDAGMIREVFEKCSPAVVVHAGAMSKPDECELNRERSHFTNVEATRNLLSQAERSGSFFVFISTDFVFDGKKGMYHEDDLPSPVNYYGVTKLEAEEAVRNYRFHWAIVRTVLVYGKPQAGRDNLLTTVKGRLEKGEEYRVFHDQVRTPTYVEDLAAGIMAIIEKKAAGIWNLSGKDILTPYEMALATASYLHLDASLIRKATAETFRQPALRPPRTGLDISKAEKLLGYKPVSFQEGLAKTFT